MVIHGRIHSLFIKSLILVWVIVDPGSILGAQGTCWESPWMGLDLTRVLYITESSCI